MSVRFVLKVLGGDIGSACGHVISTSCDDVELPYVKDSRGGDIMFLESDYINIGTKVSALEIVEKLGSLLSFIINSNLLTFVKCKEIIDVRYAAYYSSFNEEFVPICIQDFDVPDYVEENFVPSGNGIIEFYECDYIPSKGDFLTPIAERLCFEVCELLNSRGVTAEDLKRIGV